MATTETTITYIVARQDTLEGYRAGEWVGRDEATEYADRDEALEVAAKAEDELGRMCSVQVSRRSLLAGAVADDDSEEDTLVCGRRVQSDPGGVGHAWRNKDAADLHALVSGCCHATCGR